MIPPPRSISVKKRWKPLPKAMRIPCWSLLWSLLTILCSIMNIGALSRIQHLPARQTLPRSGSGEFSGIYYSGWLALQQLQPQSNGLQKWALLEEEAPQYQNPEALPSQSSGIFPKRVRVLVFDGYIEPSHPLGVAAPCSWWGYLRGLMIPWAMLAEA